MKPEIAEAEPSGRYDSETRGYHVVKSNLGLFSAVGEIGLTYAYSFPSHAEIEAGIGLGIMGVQLSLMPRILLGSGSHFFTLGLGVSDAIATSRSFYQTNAAWLNSELAGYEYRGDSGLTLSISAGIKVGLGGGKHKSICFTNCTEEDDEIKDIAGKFGPQARLGFGYRF